MNRHPFAGSPMEGGGGGGVAGLSTANGGTALADNVIVRGDGTTGIQGSIPTIRDTGALVLGTTLPAGSASEPALLFSTDGSEPGLYADVNGEIIGAKNGFNAFVLGTNTGSIRVRSGSSYFWSSDSSDATASLDTAIARAAAAVVRVTDGSTGFGYLQTAGNKRVTANQTVTDSTTLVDSTDLTVSVAAGRSYTFRAELPFTTVNTSGVKVAMAGTATHTNVLYDVVIHGISTPGFLTSGRATAIGTAVGVTASGTAARATITGTTTVNAGGTLLVQFAQNAEGAGAESVILLRGGSFDVIDVA